MVCVEWLNYSIVFCWLFIVEGLNYSIVFSRCVVQLLIVFFAISFKVDWYFFGEIPTHISSMELIFDSCKTVLL